MINADEQFGGSIVKQLEKEKLFSPEELKRIKEYLCGAAGEEVLEQFDYKDLTDLSEPDVLHEFYINMLVQEREEEAGRFEKLFFAIGEASIHSVFLSDWENCIMLELPQRVAVHGAILGRDQRLFRPREIERLIACAEHNPENLIKAIRYRSGKKSCGVLMLLMTYFYIKYPEKKEGMRLEGADALLMEQYEALVTELIPEIYPESFAHENGEKIAAALREDRMEEISELLADSSAGDWDRNRWILCMLSGVSFVNYHLSLRLKNTVSVCLAADWNIVLNFIERVDFRKELKGALGGCFDHVFLMESRDYVQWAARNRKIGILEALFAREQDVFLAFMKDTDLATYYVMEPVVKKAAPQLLPQRVDIKCKIRSKLIDAYTARSGFSKKAGDYTLLTDSIKKYLNGEGGIELVHACKGIWENGYYWWDKAIKALENYEMKYGRDDLNNRCVTLTLAGRGYIVFRDFVNTTGRKLDAEELKRVFMVANQEGLNLLLQLEAYARFKDSCYVGGPLIEPLEVTAREIFREYLEKRPEETVSAFMQAGSVGRSFGLKVMAEQADDYKESILSFRLDSAKAVKETLLEILYGQKGWEEEIAGMLSAKKAAERDMAIRVLAKWMGETPQESEKWEKYNLVLVQALEKEKNTKVRALLESVLNRSVACTQNGGIITRDDLVKELHKGNKKRNLAWAYGTPFSKVHKKDGTEASEEYLQAIFLCYSSMTPCGISQSAASLAEALDGRELAIYVNELFDKWMKGGAEAKKRWVLYAAAIHGGEEILQKLEHQIQEWPKESRGAIASEAVRALTLSPEPQGVLFVDGISRKFKFKQIRAAAAKALDFAASQLGITSEELIDRMIPDLGFDEHMQRVFDYGERKFTVRITISLEIEVFDEKGKKLKNLPAPGKKDDGVRAAEAYEEFKQMKKQMKNTVSAQKMRLESAFFTERKWSVRAWKDLFVNNPIMHQFAIGLIWGVYEERNLAASFRYMEDGSFNTEKEEEFILPDAACEKKAGQTASQGEVIGRGQVIGLVHPIELSKESLSTWKEQLEDYEIVQPIQQLHRQVFYRTEEEGKQRKLHRFYGVNLNGLSLGGKLLAQGWCRGEVQDAGWFYTYYREVKELDLAAVLYFSGGSVMAGNHEEVTIYDIRFFPWRDFSSGQCNGDGEADAMLLSEVPERYFSEIVLQVAKAAASGTAEDGN